MTGVGPSNSELGEQSQTNNDWPTCWTLVQKNDFCLRHEWLYVRNQKLGCTPCGKVGTLGVEAKTGMKVSREWANNEITYYGDERKQQLYTKENLRSQRIGWTSSSIKNSC